MQYNDIPTIKCLVASGLQRTMWRKEFKPRASVRPARRIDVQRVALYAFLILAAGAAMFEGMLQ
jgi:hypothetical protein